MGHARYLRWAQRPLELDRDFQALPRTSHGSRPIEIRKLGTTHESACRDAKHKPITHNRAHGCPETIRPSTSANRIRRAHGMPAGHIPPGRPGMELRDQARWLSARGG